MLHLYLLAPLLVRLKSPVCFERHYREKCIDSSGEKDAEGGNRGWVCEKKRKKREGVKTKWEGGERERRHDNEPYL